MQNFIQTSLGSLVVVLLIIGGLSVAGCGSLMDSDAGFGVDLNVGSVDETPSAEDVVIHEDVVIIDDDPCVQEVLVSDDREVLTFVFGCDPIGRGVEPGKIVVGVEQGGYLRRIDSVAFDGWTVTAWTSPASLAEAVEQGGFSLSLGGSEARNMIDLSNTILYEGTILGSDVLAKLNRGRFDISPLIEMAGHWGDGEVQLFDFDTDFEIEADFEVFVSSTNGLRVTKEMNIWETSYPFDTSIGPLPLVGEAGVRAKVGFRADAPGQGSMTTGLEANVHWGNGRQFRLGDGWSESPDEQSSWEFHEPDIEVSSGSKLRAYVRLETFVTFYDSSGPEIQAEIYSELNAAPDCEGIHWEANAGLEVRAKVKFNILDKFKPTKVFGMVDLTAELVDGTLPYPFGFPVPCAQPEIRCGDVVSGDTSEMVNQLDGYSCNVGNYDAPEAIYEWQADWDGLVEWALVNPTPMEVNHDVMVLDGAMNLVFAQCQAWGSNYVVFEATAGELYYLVVDGYGHDAGLFEAALTCD